MDAAAGSLDAADGATQPSVPRSSTPPKLGLEMRLVPGSRAATKQPIAESNEELVIDTAGAVAYVLGETVAPALMGLVRRAKSCVRQDGGGAGGSGWAAAAGAAQSLVVKQLDKRCIAAGRTTTGLRVREDPKTEVAVLRLVAVRGHPNVVRLVDVLEDAEHLYVIFAACEGGELLAAAMGPAPALPALAEEQARDYAFQIVRGVRFLHSLGVCHRDLSLENAMLATGSQRTVQIIDMGLSARLSPAGSVPHDGRVGKARYCPPEVHACRGGEYDGRSADAWQVGVCVFALLFRRYVWEAPTPLDPCIRHLSAGGRLRDLLAAWRWDEGVSAAALALLDGLLRVDPRERLGLADAESHPWFAPCHAAALAADEGARAEAAAP